MCIGYGCHFPSGPSLAHFHSYKKYIYLDSRHFPFEEVYRASKALKPKKVLVEYNPMHWYLRHLF